MIARTIFPVTLFCCALAGCGGSLTPDAATQSQPVEPVSSKALAIKKVDAAKLPNLGEYFQPLDNDTIEVASPHGWLRKGRAKEYLAAFVKEKSAPVPAILVKTTEPVTGDAFADVTADNVIDFTAAIQATLQEPVESALPMIIGNHAFARYVKDVKIGGLPAEVQVLCTVRDCRMYTIELRVRDVEDLKKYRDHAYAVAVGLKFGADAKPFEFKPETLPGAATPPAAAPAAASAEPTKPAETQPAGTK